MSSSPAIPPPPELPPRLRQRLVRLLEESQSLGFLGPGPVDQHLSHSFAFVSTWRSSRRLVGDHESEPTSVLDLGTGGGPPGIVLAALWSSSSVSLLDSNQRRAEFLRSSVRALGEESRVQVLEGRAEDFARTRLRATFAVVTARGFAPPAVTAECAAPMLSLGGLLIVSEPPGSSEARWPTAGLSTLGLEPHHLTVEPFAMRALRQSVRCPEDYPRRVGIPGKRPLWTSS